LYKCPAYIILYFFVDFSMESKEWVFWWVLLFFVSGLFKKKRVGFLGRFFYNNPAYQPQVLFDQASGKMATKRAMSAGFLRNFEYKFPDFFTT